jgi:hypothetical protein
MKRYPVVATAALFAVLGCLLLGSEGCVDGDFVIASLTLCASVALNELLSHRFESLAHDALQIDNPLLQIGWHSINSLVQQLGGHVYGVKSLFQDANLPIYIVALSGHGLVDGLRSEHRGVCLRIRYLLRLTWH